MNDPVERESKPPAQSENSIQVVYLSSAMLLTVILIVLGQVTAIAPAIFAASIVVGSAIETLGKGRNQ